MFINWGDNRVAQADSNLFWNGGGDIVVDGGPGSGLLHKWQEVGFDQGSAVADPLFMDVSRRDFHLQRGSPALELGFQPIEVDGIGLQEDFPQRLARD